MKEDNISQLGDYDYDAHSVNNNTRSWWYLFV